MQKQGRKPNKVKVERPVLDEFKPGTRFHDAVDLYVFDKKLRLLALDAMERIEIALARGFVAQTGREEPLCLLAT